MIRWIMLLAGISFGSADLVAPFTVDLISTKNAFFDTIQVTTYLTNIGSTSTIPNAFGYTAVSVGIDSFSVLKLHAAPANTVLDPKSVAVYIDTLTPIKGPFAIVTEADPIRAYCEAGSIGNDVRSQAYDFHPTIQHVHDTTVVYDTLRLRDTLKVVQKDTVSITLHDTTRVSVTDTIFQRDTVRVVVRDTVIKRDTIQVGPPTLAKAASLAYMAPVASVVYNAAGAKVWEGMLPPGAYPPAGLRPGLHLIVQGDRARRFRIAYR